MTLKPPIHGRDHVCGGSDPIPELCGLLPASGGFPDYETGVLSFSSLVGYWRLGEGAEPFLDTSGYQPSDPADAEIISHPIAMTEDYTPGALDVDDDGAVAFNKEGPASEGDFSDVLTTVYSTDLGRFDFLGTLPFTIACWIRPIASGESWTASVVSNMELDSSPTVRDDGWQINMTWPERTVAFRRAANVPAAGSYTEAVSPEGLDDDNWHYVVGSYDGAMLRLYIAGALVATQADSGVIGGTTARQPSIGNGNQDHGITDGWFYGAIDEVAVWSEALTPSEIAALYAAASGPTADEAGKVLTSDGAGGTTYAYPTIAVDDPAGRYDTINLGANLTGTDEADGSITIDAASADPADDTHVWMPLTTVVGGDPELVWDGNDNLIPTLTPL